MEPYKCPCHVCLPPSQTVTEPELWVEHAEEPQTVVEVDVHAVGVRATIEPVEADSIRVKPTLKYLRLPGEDSPAYIRKRTKRKAVESDDTGKTAKKTRHDFDTKISPCKVKLNRQVQPTGTNS